MRFFLAAWLRRGGRGPTRGVAARPAVPQRPPTKNDQEDGAEEKADLCRVPLRYFISFRLKYTPSAVWHQ